MSQFNRTKLILELALKQASPSNRDLKENGDEKCIEVPATNHATSTEVATSTEDTTLPEHNPDGNLLPSISNFILVPNEDDNCFVLEADDDNPGILTELKNCILLDKIPEQPRVGSNLKENSSLSPLNASLSENYLDLETMSIVGVENNVNLMEISASALKNDEENIQEINRPEIVDHEDDDYIPSEDEMDASEYQSDDKEISYKRKRAKRGKANQELWIANCNKLKRSQGLEYFGRRKTEQGKVVFDVKRPKKTMRSRCSCLEKNLRGFGCANIFDSMREKIFKQFYSLDNGEKRVWIRGLVDKKPVAQRTVEAAGASRRQYSFVYYLKPDETTKRIKVCKRMFLATLSIGEWAVHDWVSQVSEQKDSESNAHNARVQKKTNGKTGSARRTKTSIERKLLSEFFENLPKLESHYCRKSTTKLYLEPKWQSKAELFRLYKDFCKSLNKDNLITSIFSFYTVFDELNLALFSPKKDQCDICCAHKSGNISEEMFQEHIRRKDEARKQKEDDKASNDNKTSVFTMDLEAVLLCPSLKASALYYRTKLKVHNFTLYDLKTGAGYCYLWDETEGQLNADEFASILYNFITNEVNKGENIIIYSDGCTYQNRNTILANTLLLISMKLGIVITQKFLEKGHTQMECDAMHSCIERRIKNREIYSPVAYIEACRTARIHPAPYKVQYLEHNFFKKFSDLKFITSIRPGLKKGDPVVTDIKCIKYTPDGNIQVKLDFQEEFSNLPRRLKCVSCETAVRNLYEKKVPLQAIKFKHLQEMKSVLPRQVHSYYDALPHMSNAGNKLCDRETCSCIIPVIVKN